MLTREILLRPNLLPRDLPSVAAAGREVMILTALGQIDSESSASRKIRPWEIGGGNIPRHFAANEEFLDIESYS
jgi:hypothetical protein